MWYRATYWCLTFSAVILVAAACTLGYAFVEDTRAESATCKTVFAVYRPAADIANRTLERLRHEKARLTRFPCLGHCALAEFYNDHPNMRGRIPLLVEAVLRIKLADLLKQRLDARAVVPHSRVQSCLSKSRRSECANLAMVAGD